MIHAVILAGGKGKRFWPLSRESHPKQFLKLFGKKSLLEQTTDRLFPLVSFQHIWIVSSVQQKKFFTIPISQDHFLLEPKSRNTAASIGWAAFELVKKDPEAVMIILPSDHLIQKKTLFHAALKQAVHAALKGRLATIGIPPLYPHTGYGYIEIENPSLSVSPVKSFKEKPDLKTAERYLKEGRYFWNSGMFIWKAQTILSLFEYHLPHHYSVLKAMTASRVSLKAQKKYFETLQDISIDYAIMEKAASQTDMVRASFSWSDVGSWNALEALWPKDKQENVKKGHLLAVNSGGNIVYSPKKVIALLDIENLVIIDSPDALLVMPKSSAQKIQHLYDNLPKKFR